MDNPETGNNRQDTEQRLTKQKIQHIELKR